MKGSIINLWCALKGDREMHEYAGLLRIGEDRRDASEKIRGFLYQDLLAINLILNSNEGDKIYVEWVEDVMVENTSEISIYQVKHYPKTKLILQDVYKDMFYQFLKFKLHETQKKKIKTYCLYHAEKYKDINETDRSYIEKENDIETVDKADIIERFKKCGNIEERKKLIFSEVASISLLGEFDFKKKEKKHIKEESRILRNKLYSDFNKSVSRTISQIIGEDGIKDILMAIAIQYIQKSYYNKLEDYRERYMTKVIFREYISRILDEDEQRSSKNINFIVLSYIDKVFDEIGNEIENEEAFKTYKEIYFSTKTFFMKNLETKEQRFKFLNSISTDEYEELNIHRYMEEIMPEINKFLEHKDKIMEFIRKTWKILFNLDCKDFGKFIREDDECLFFDFPHEKVKPALVLSPIGDTTREASKTLSRILKMKIKPRKWYFKDGYKGVHKYSFDVNRIRKAKLNGEFSILLKEQDCFRIECMKCIKTGEEEMEIKDQNLEDCLFDFNCIEGGD